MPINIYTFISNFIETNKVLDLEEIQTAVDEFAAKNHIKYTNEQRNTIVAGLYSISDSGYSQPKEYRYQLEEALGESDNFNIWFDLDAKDRLVVYACIVSWQFYFGRVKEYDMCEFIKRTLCDVANHSESRWKSHVEYMELTQ